MFLWLSRSPIAAIRTIKSIHRRRQPELNQEKNEKGEKTKMKILKNKSKISAITFVLVLTISAVFVALPAANAHDPAWNVPAWCYAGVTPRTTGVGQQVIIVFWLNAIPPTAATDSRFGDRWTFYVDITAPDGSTETVGPITSDPVGGAYILYTPDQVGTYTIVARMPAHEIIGLPSASGEPIDHVSVGDIYGPATSEPAYLTVQEEPVEGWPDAPVTDDYWTRPINNANRYWYVLAGNWLGGAAQSFAPGCSPYVSTSGFGTPNGDAISHGQGTESAHILWTRPHWAGGIMDELFGTTGYQTSHYQGISLGNPIIIQGKIIVTYRKWAHGDDGWWVIDLYTGETLSLENDTRIPAFGQIYNYESPNQHGGFPYVWRTSGVTLPEGYTTERGKSTWEMLDGYTLQSITMIANVSAPRGSVNVYGKDGSILYYSLVTSGGVQYLQVWNSSAIPSLLGGETGTNFWQWRPMGGAFGFGAAPFGYYVHDGNQAYSLNVSISTPVQGSILSVREGEFIIGGTGGSNSEAGGVVQGNLWCLSLKKGEEGKLLWNRTFTPPRASTPDPSIVNRAGATLGIVDPEDGVFLFEEQLTTRRWGYSLETMQPLWGPTAPEEAFHFYGMSESIYEGKLLSYGYGGQMIAYNITTGEILWKYNATSIGLESAYGGFYPIGIACIADGKLYTVSSEHSPTQPMYRGPNLRCINASNGVELWSILFWGARMSPTESNVYIADGIVFGLNYHDMELYAFGKGPSATTVTASPKVSALGSSVVIEGTVTDQSPSGKRNTNGLLDFTLKGTPAISDEDMSAWMEYMFMQQPMPKDAKGVTVHLTAIDPNGNYQDIGYATSDTAGKFATSWQPPVPGEYFVTAEFEGSASYGSSFDTTFFTVDEAPSPAQPIEPEAPTEPEEPEAPTEPEEPEAPTEPEPTEPEEPEEPTEPEPTEPAEAPLFSTTDLAIIAAVAVAAVIGIAAYWQLRKRK
jgi:hypothetical protein